MDKIRSQLNSQIDKFKLARWITEKEAEVLCDLIKEHNIEEVYESGTANGYSSCKMSETGIHIVTFDPYDRLKIWDEPEFEFYKDQIEYINTEFSALQLEPIEGKRLFFIDGDHSGVGATEDVEAVLKYIAPGDVIVLHDMSEKKIVKVWQRMDKSSFDCNMIETERVMAVLVKKGEQSLKELAYHYGTDKKHTRHNFVAIYDELFKDFRYDKINFLEIGIYLCRSHNMWVEWFPNANIYGIDIEAKRKRYEKSRLILDIVDQSDREQLLNYANEKGPWKVVIDDGSHVNSHQKISFEVLWDFVESDGYYIVEDVHSSYWPHLIDCDETLMEYMLKITNEVCTAPHYKGYYSSIECRRKAEQLTKYQNEVEYMTYRSGMLIIKKHK